MPHSDPAEILVIHNRWANEQLLAACASLTDQQMDREFEMGVNTLRKTITHILGAMRGWTDMLAGREQRPRLEHEQRSIAELAALHEEAADDFEAAVRAHPLEAMATGTRGGRTYSFARGAVLTHVTTHGMHHRAQALNMLRQLGVDPLPRSAVVEWMVYVDGPAS